MKRLFLFCLFAFWIHSSFAFGGLMERGSAYSLQENQKIKRTQRFGAFHVDVGLYRFQLQNSKVRGFYYQQFGKVALMPAFRGTYFFNLNPFAIGLGFGLSYHRASGTTKLEDGSKGQYEDILVYLPYQFFVDFKLALFDSFLITNLWVGYQEAFIENRRGKPTCEICNASTKVLITEKGYHWNNSLNVGLSVGLSLKGLGSARNFRAERSFGLYDVYAKLFSEYDFNLKSKNLLFGRKMSGIDLSSWKAGLLFTFEL